MIKLIEEKRLEKLIDKDRFLVIAVSTGIDSMSLFHYLYNLRYKIVIAHVNHKRRIESDTEYEYLKSLANSLNVPFVGYIMPKIEKGNFQEEARSLRYKFFLEVAKEYNTDQIVIAHQEDDKVETILMRLIRGTALRGYRGIMDVSYIDNFKIIRPLLYTTREKISEYQKENNIKYFEDSSNSEDHYTRNIIRHKITPVLKTINPNIYQSFNNFSDDVSMMYDLVDKLALKFLKDKAKKTSFEISFSATDFNDQELIVKRQIVLRSINILSNNTLELSHQKISEILSQKIESESKIIEINDKIKLSIEYDNYVFFIERDIKKVNIEITKEGDYIIDDSRKIIASQNYHLLPEKKSYLLCYNNTDNIYPIYVRNVEQGDKIIINNKTKKVYDLLKENKVPKRLRQNCLVFYNKDGIFFVPDIARKETDLTKKNKIYFTYLGDL